MNQMLGDIKLIPYDDVPVGWLRCSGQALYINEYPKLYMLIGTKFGKKGKFQFRLPDLTKDEPEGQTYCIATEGKVPEIHGKNMVSKDQI
ncbi:phage tail protein [Abyssisolibacter fermentans]|uniref:phage tail protein n=1 Tax=Abyssisolibacter fermentans TaxID=1766203 RepID=UPI00082ECB00|nr:phage tail protein [Abyssisolibacter fermentans]